MILGVFKAYLETVPANSPKLTICTNACCNWTSACGDLGVAVATLPELVVLATLVLVLKPSVAEALAEVGITLDELDGDGVGDDEEDDGGAWDVLEGGGGSGVVVGGGGGVVDGGGGGGDGDGGGGGGGGAGCGAGWLVPKNQSPYKYPSD